MSNEFDIIQKYFTRFPLREDVSLGIGDDAAIVIPPADQQLVVTVDTLISGVHFPESASAESVGHKSLAVNLSDLAAMGATPRWFTLALSLPEADENWLHAFSRGMQELANRYHTALIGGDTTKGPLSITVQALGTVVSGHGVKRNGARPGDDIYVSGTLGDAGLGLASIKKQLALAETDQARCVARLDFPEPRLQLGNSLLTIATSMIDCSDGFVADLGHILEQSGVGAEIELSRLPLSTVVQRHVNATADWSLPLSAGDDFELIFTAPAQNRNEIAGLIDSLDCTVTAVGRITQSSGLLLRQKNGELYQPEKSGYLHFE